MEKPRRAAILLAPSLAAYTQTPPEEARIRALRSASNHAIQTGDVAAFSAILSDDFVVIIGNGALLTRDQYLAAFAADFATPGTVRYERIADSIGLSISYPLAAEHGHWVGRLPNGRTFYTGTYMAMWHHSDETGWKLRSELFVSLTSSDSASGNAHRNR